MSIAKTLIRKEIEKYKRVIPVREADNKRFQKLQEKPENPKKPIDYSGLIDGNKNDIILAKKYIKELEKDLKKL